METAFFWIAWGLISFWALKSFYYSFSKEKVKRLCKAALGINFAVLVLTFLPWLPASPIGGPQSLGGKTGFSLALEGNILAVLFLFFLITSIVLFLMQVSPNLKIASSTTILNTFILFALMMQIRPGTFTLSFFDIVPIIAFMFLLVCDVVVLLLWQQLQLNKNKQRKKR